MTLTPIQRQHKAQELGILVDPEDAWLLYTFTWYRQSKGYIRTSYEGKEVNIHHCIMGQPIWEGETIDHKDRNPTNNKRNNLRWASPKQQVANSARIARAAYITETVTGGYLVRISKDGVQYNLGTYRTMEEAITVRDKQLHAVSSE